jgi:fructose-1,6-bisphosphatase/sedoheptulose 1,7-bisphosphatase-like protein
MPPGKIERNIAMELVRVTEAAALAAARYLGRDLWRECKR